MKPHPTSARILVASDNADDAAQIIRQLKGDFTELRSSTDSDKAVEDFEDFDPDVLILAFDAVEKAQGYALGLYRFSQRVSDHGHRTILLCDKAEIQHAFELCKKGSFDDYVLYWPQAQDGLRLLMSVWSAARHVIAPPSSGPSHVDLVSHLKQLGTMQSLVEQQLSEGERHAVTAGGSLQQAERTVGGAIDDLFQRLTGSGSTGRVDVSDPVALAREFDQLKSPVSKAFEATAKAMAPTGGWTRQLKEKLAPHLTGLRAIGEKIGQTKPLVMVVDDDQFARKMIQTSLEGKSYELIFAHDGTAALGLLRRIRPDLILMDINLPDIDGVTLTQKLKALPWLAEIPVLMLTGEARRETLQNSMKAGAAGFIVKPFTAKMLNERLGQFLSAPTEPVCPVLPWAASR
jgi:CheY-like chemotaxis protein